MNEQKTPAGEQASLGECNAQRIASLKASPTLEAQADLTRAQAKLDAARTVEDAKKKASRILEEAHSRADQVAGNAPELPKADFTGMKKKELVALAVKSGLKVTGNLTVEQLRASLEEAGVRPEEPSSSD